MKLADWIFTFELATFRGIGQPMMHAYVAGSASPLCMPKVAGEPPSGLGGVIAMPCAICRQQIQDGFWSWVPFGKRFAWIVRIGYPHPRTARGTAEDAVDALKQCIAALEKLVPGDVPVEAHRGYADDAEQYARELRADARAERPSKDVGDAQVTEFAYRHTKAYRAPWGLSDFVYETERARITKKTAKRIFVEASIKTTEKGNLVLRTWSLDRAELDRGKKSRSGWTLDPNPPFVPSDGKRSVPGWADVLGLSIPCTLADAKRAFRSKAKAAHPDQGGSPEAFQRVKSAFDAASQQLGASA